jgi:aryl-alcohol dehydrogenase-like predicted oxidoreductase
MKYRQLGKSGLLVSELCFGTLTFGGSGYWNAVGTLGDEGAKRLVDRAVSSVIIGANNEEQLGDNLRSVDWVMPAEDVELLDKASTPYRPYPHWMNDFTRRERLPAG